MEYSSDGFFFNDLRHFRRLRGDDFINKPRRASTVKYFLLNQRFARLWPS